MQLRHGWVAKECPSRRFYSEFSHKFVDQANSCAYSTRLPPVSFYRATQTPKKSRSPTLPVQNGMVLFAVLVQVTATVTATRAADAWSRRTAVGVSVLAATSPSAALAASKGGVQWSIDLPPAFEVQRQLASIVRIKTETVLLADDPTTGAQAKLLLLPFGQQAGASLNADDQLSLATFFFAAPSAEPLSVGAETVASTMANSASRSPGITSLTRFSTPKAYAEASGRRYVRYGYSAQKCTGELDGAECVDGSLIKRRTLATVTMSSISQYRTNTERERMRELGQARNVEVLWLLTFSAPDAAFDALQPAFEKASASFYVPLEVAS